MTETRTLPSANLRSAIIPALVLFVAIVWWAGRRGSEHASYVASPGTATLPNSQLEGPRPAAVNDTESRGTTSNEGRIEVGADATFGAYVDGKYRFLQASPNLREALLAREKIAVAINTARQSSDTGAKEAIPQQLAELSALDQKIGTLLRPGDLATFEVLKDSDIEQFQLDDYAGGVAAVAPLDDADRKAILQTKLIHRQRFRQVLADSGLMRGGLNATERQYAFGEVSRALAQSRDSYLQEVRQYLYDDEQFTLLSNYEKTEYAAELEKLRGIAQRE